MLLCIGAATATGYYFLGLGLGLGLVSAVLLGTVIAPTDPVLASDVQVGPPNEGMKSETKFALTSEPGLNDGVAFLLIVRPVFGWLVLNSSKMKNKERLAIGFWHPWNGFDIPSCICFQQI